MIEEMVAHAGLRFRCRVDGREGAPWMVCSNSLVTDLTVWDAQVAAFGERFRILRYDQRGHGGTDVPAGPTTIDELAGDAAALMERFGVRDAVFMGVSMGAATGFCLAASRPELVGRLVASDGQAATAPGGAQGWQERIDAATRDEGASLPDVTVGRWFSARAKAEGSAAIPVVRAMVAGTKLAGFVACARALQDYDYRAALPGLEQPALLIAGAEDGAMPKTMREIAAVMKRARFVEIADAGHIPGIERPEAFTAAVAEFLR